LKVYEPRPVTLKALRYVLPSIVLVYLLYVTINNPLVMGPAATFVIALLLGSAVYFGVFAGRVWVYLYEEYLVFQGPISHYLESSFGWRIGTTLIPYQRISALGRAGAGQETSFPDGKGCFLVVHRGRGWRRRKFFILCNGNEQYRDLMSELLKRVRQDCNLYTWKPFGRRGSF
jgi:hypothetical protein